MSIALDSMLSGRDFKNVEYASGFSEVISGVSVSTSA